MACARSSRVEVSCGRHRQHARVDPHASPIGERVLVAWDSSRESAMAVRDALPLLRKASQVSLATLCTSEHFEERQSQGREITVMSH